MRLVCISDIHNKQDSLSELPYGDVLIVAGDISASGNPGDLEKFNTYLGKYKDKYKEIIMTLGNHEIWAEANLAEAIKILNNAKVLINESHTLYNGRIIYGSPVCPYFGGWAFNVSSHEERKVIWSYIPDNVDIVVTHTPAYGILDDVSDDFMFRRTGCSALSDRLYHLKNLKLHICGHIHEAYGHKRVYTTQDRYYECYNVSISRRFSNLLNPPTVVVLND